MDYLYLVISELRVLNKIAPQVLTAEQKTILEYADTLEKDAYLEAHPELIGSWASASKKTEKKRYRAYRFFSGQTGDE